MDNIVFAQKPNKDELEELLKKEYPGILFLSPTLKDTDVEQIKNNIEKQTKKINYFLSLAVLAAQRSTCIRRKVGCIAVKDDRVIATGYNGAPSGMTHCTTETCYRMKNNIPSGEKLDMCYAVHAEQNVICQAAIHGVSIKGCDIYITTTPCTTCLKLLAQIGVKTIYTLSNYATNDINDNIISQKDMSICKFDMPDFSNITL